MRIGIITLPFHTNYGGVLQAYALQKYLTSLGHEVYVIDRKYIPGCLKSLTNSIYYWIKSLFTGKKHVSKTRNYKRAALHFCDFIKNNFEHYVIINNKHRINDLHCDALIVGSDQVWKNSYSKDIFYYYLDFCMDRNTIKLSYAASFGSNELIFSNDEKRQISFLLKKFKAISVRECDAVDFCKDTFGCDSKLVLDPTFLLYKEDYLKICSDYPITKKHRLVTFILDPSEEKSQIIEKISKIVGDEPYAINLYQYMGTECKKVVIMPRIEYWLQELAMADYVVTDSFHGTAFSINFNKEFFVLSNQRRGQSRLTSILGLAGLKDRLINSNSQLDKLIKNKIDWSSVNDSLQDYRIQSMCFLQDNLS